MKLYTYSANSNADPALTRAVQYIGNLWTSELAEGNVQPIVDSFGEGFKCYVPNVGIQDNKQAAAAWQQGVDDGLRQITIETLEIVSEGSLGYETGAYSILNDQETASESGHYLFVWRLENGEWKWHRQMWNYHFKAD